MIRDSCFVIVIVPQCPQRHPAQRSGTYAHVRDGTLVSDGFNGFGDCIALGRALIGDPASPQMLAPGSPQRCRRLWTHEWQ